MAFRAYLCPVCVWPPLALVLRKAGTLSSGSVVLSYCEGMSSATFGITKNYTVRTVE
jgi:hypothetical protein